MLEIGERVDHFQVTGLLGRGGMGEVYQARDTVLGRKVALKVVNPELLGSKQSIERFLFEARATARFNHPHIVTIFGVGRHQGRPYIAMEHLEGQTLKQRMREEWPSFRASLRIGLAIAQALQEAHSHKILHRDLKPENVLIPRDGRLRVVDFGLAKSISGDVTDPGVVAQWDLPGTSEWVDVVATGIDTTPPDSGSNSGAIDSWHPTLSSDDDLASNLTSSGKTIFGTPPYMAPEQWLGQDATGATDVWAMGSMLFELVAKRRIYPEQTVAGLANKVISPIPTPSLSLFVEAPPELCELVDRCLHKDPLQRPKASEVVTDLKGLVYQRRSRTKGELSPFRGLLPFAEQHADFFFGREAEVAAFLERLRGEPVLPVVGPSGAGKSSFVQAGILPRLREQGGWTFLTMQPGDSPFLALASRLVGGDSPLLTERDNVTVRLRSPGEEEETAGSEEKEQTPDWLQDENALANHLRQNPKILSLLLHKVADDSQKKVLLFVDQLEEIVTQVVEDDLRQSFLFAICAAADDARGPVRVVFTLRDDFLGRLAMSGRVREVLSLVTVIRSPAPEMLEEIITKPVQVVGYSYDDPALVGEMVRSVEGEPACLPLLQFATQVLWERRDREKNLLCRSVYQSVGGVAGALAEHADSVHEGFSAEQIAVSRQLLLRLVASDGSRRVVAKNAALEGLGTEAQHVLDRLARSRLITVRKDLHGELDTALQLVHESLVHTWQRLAHWLDESREEIVFLEEIGQAAGLWLRRGQRDEETWRGPALREAERTVQRCTTEVPDLVRRFLKAGHRRQRRLVLLGRMRLGVTVGLLALVAIGASIVAFTLSRKNQEVERQTAQAQLEGARRALEQGDLMEARARLRRSLEEKDSSLARLLWWRTSNNPLIWKRRLGSQCNAVVFDPRGGHMAVACADKAIYLLDVKTRAVVRVLRGHSDQVFAIAFSPNGGQLASGSWDGEVRLWSTDQREQSVLLGQHQGAIYGLDFHPHGMMLASAGADQQIRLWNLHSGQQSRELIGHQDMVRAVAFHPDGTVLASAGSDNSVRLWDLANGEQIGHLPGHTDAVLGLAFSGSGKLLASSGKDHTIWIWNVEQSRPQQMLRGHRAAVWSVAFSPDGNFLASASADKKARIWNLKTGRTVQYLEGHKGPALCVEYSPSGQYLATVSEDRSVRLWANRGGMGQAPGVGHTAMVYGVAFSPDGRFVASGSRDRSIRLWDVRSGDQRAILLGHTDAVLGISFEPRGKQLASGSKDATVRLWDLQAGNQQKILFGHRDAVYGVSYSPDGALLATAGLDASVRLWNPGSGRLRHETKLESAVYDVSFSGDGRWLAAASKNRKVQLLQLPSASRGPALQGHTAAVLGARFSANGKILASGSEDKSIWLWDVDSKSGHLLGELGGRVYWIDVDASGTLVGAPSSDGTATIWNTVSGEQLVLRGHHAEVNYFRFSSDGKLAATSSDDGTVRLWQVENGRPYWRAPMLLSSPTQLLTHNGWTALDVSGLSDAELSQQWRQAVQQRAKMAVDSPVGGLICLVTHDGVVELWDSRQDKKLWQKTAAGVDRALVLPSGCLVKSGGELRFLQRDGSEIVIREEGVTAIALDGADILVASGQQVQVHGVDGAKQQSYPADLGVTAIARDSVWLVVGYGDGNVELISLKSGERRTSFSFEDVPASSVQRLTFVARDTVVVGYANGLVGMWSIKTGKRLQHSQLHGPVAHLFLDVGKLYAATELGNFVVWDLNHLHMAHCDLLREVWSSVPVVWQQGLPVLAKPPTGHDCY